MSIKLNPLSANERDPDPSCRFSREKHESWTHTCYNADFDVYAAKKTVRKTRELCIARSGGGLFCEAQEEQNTVTRDRQRSSQTYRLEEEQRPNIIPLGVDDFIQHAEPEPLLPVRVFGVVDTVLQMPVVLFHDSGRTSRRASRSLRQAPLFFCKYPHFHASSGSSVHRAGARSPENGDKDHAGVRGCATHRTLETKFCLPPPKKKSTRATVGEAT